MQIHLKYNFPHMKKKHLYNHILNLFKSLNFSHIKFFFLKLTFKYIFIINILHTPGVHFIIYSASSVSVYLHFFICKNDWANLCNKTTTTWSLFQPNEQPKSAAAAAGAWWCIDAVLCCWGSGVCGWLRYFLYYSCAVFILSLMKMFKWWWKYMINDDETEDFMWSAARQKHLEYLFCAAGASMTDTIR